MKHDVFNVLEAAISAGVVSSDGDAKKLLKLVELMESVRFNAIEECAKLCNEVAGEYHTRYWQARENRQHELATALLDKRELCETIKVQIRTTLHNHGGQHAAFPQSQGRNPDSSQDGQVGRAA